MNRWIDLDGVANMRDLGGLPTRGGGRIAPRRLIRSDNLQDLTPADVERLIDFGVSDIVDLRSNREVRLTGDGPLRATVLRHHHHSFFPEPTDRKPRNGSAADAWTTHDQPARERDSSYWSQHYRGYLTGRPDSVSAALSVVAAADGATILHCAAGKDRTGTVVALALALAGVPREVIVADYVLTSERLARVMDRLVDRPPYSLTLAGRDPGEQVPLASSMETLLDALDDDFGGADGYLLLQGWSPQGVEALRARLVTP